MTRTVLHLVPYDSVGGVETAVRSVPVNWDGPTGSIRFQRGYLVRQTPVEYHPGDWHGPCKSVNNPRAHLQLLRFVLAAQPDLVVASLWRCCPVLIALKSMRPKVKTVIFLHSAVDTHAADRVLNRAAMQIADEIWADSNTTLEARIPARFRSRARVLSVLTEKLVNGGTPALAEGGRIVPTFVFWGRLQSEKDLPRTLRVFAAIHRRVPHARLEIIGPDRGERTGLEAKVIELGLTQAVRFAGPLRHEDLLAHAQHHSFYLQTSRFEGMAMSVMEAMSLGLVPVVTPVGEIARYCVDGQNGILVGDADATAERVLEVLCDRDRYLAMSEAARAAWANQPLYHEDFTTACIRLLAKTD